MSRGSKFVVILLFVVTLALAGAAVFVSYQLSQEDTQPDDTEASSPCERPMSDPGEYHNCQCINGQNVCEYHVCQGGPCPNDPNRICGTWGTNQTGVNNGTCGATTPGDGDGGGQVCDCARGDQAAYAFQICPSQSANGQNGCQWGQGCFCRNSNQTCADAAIGLGCYRTTSYCCTNGQSCERPPGVPSTYQFVECGAGSVCNPIGGTMPAGVGICSQEAPDACEQWIKFSCPNQFPGENGLPSNWNCVNGSGEIVPNNSSFTMPFCGTQQIDCNIGEAPHNSLISRNGCNPTPTGTNTPTPTGTPTPTLTNTPTPTGTNTPTPTGTGTPTPTLTNTPTPTGTLTPTPTVPITCGNGSCNVGENCDGNAQCIGGGVFTPGECRSTCTYCGDGVVQPGEECDDGNPVDNDSCNNQCRNLAATVTPPPCGTYPCPTPTPTFTLRPPICGDGVMQPGEECDYGIPNSCGPGGQCGYDCRCRPVVPGLCGSGCTSNANCPADNVCYQGTCRLAVCVPGTSTPFSAPMSSLYGSVSYVCTNNGCDFVTCGDTCGAGGACPSGLVCGVGNRCVLPYCANGGCRDVCQLPATDLLGDQMHIVIFGLLMILLGVVGYRTNAYLYAEKYLTSIGATKVGDLMLEVFGIKQLKAKIKRFGKNIKLKSNKKYQKEDFEDRFEE